MDLLDVSKSALKRFGCYREDSLVEDSSGGRGWSLYKGFEERKKEIKMRSCRLSFPEAPGGPAKTGD